jgi:DNA primase
VERDNYAEAMADKYHIGFDNLRKLITSYAAQTGLAKPIERPRSGIQQKAGAQEGNRKNQRLLITWLTEEPYLYDKVKGFLSAADFTDELYAKVADKLFDGLKKEGFSPADMISMFPDEEEQRQVAALFNTKLDKLEKKEEREKAFHDILVKVKQNSLEYYSSRLGSDVSAINQVIEAKKALENLKNTHISLQE